MKYIFYAKTYKTIFVFICLIIGLILDLERNMNSNKLNHIPKPMFYIYFRCKNVLAIKTKKAQIDSLLMCFQINFFCNAN